MPKKKRKISLKTKRKLVFYTKWALGAIAFVGFFVAFLLAVRLPEVNIATVNISGTHFADASLVKDVAEGQLKGSYLFLVPKRNAIFYPENKLKRELMGVFTPIKEVNASLEGFNILNISISEREPTAKWCEAFSSTSPCYLLDEEGFVFAPEEGGGFILYSGHIDGSPIGNTFLGGGFKNLHRLANQLPETTGRTPLRVLIDEHDDVTVYFKEGGELKFVRSSDETILLDNIASVFASQRLKTEEELQYADFRFGNKVYVKFVGE